ncbi:MAG: site-specific integrase [Tannerella sp.]|jgi:site-specific recombinase XerD|nr:site-specific integrase [Tannerella sp.]
MRSTFSTLFYVKRNQPKKNGNVVIMVRITVDGDCVQFSTKQEIHPKYWDSIAGMAKGKDVEVQKVNRALDTMRAKISQHYTHLMEIDGYATSEKIKNLLLGIVEKERTIISYFEKHNEQYRLKVGTTTTWTTYTKYELTKNRLIEFMELRHKVKDMPIKEINTVFLQDFYLFLRNEHNSGNNNAMKNMQRLKAVFNYIKNTGVTFVDPYGNFRMSFEKADRSYLDMDEVNKIMNKKFASERLEKVRDVFIFACYTGLSYSDIHDLTEDNLKTGIDGNIWIMDKRNKTGIKYNVRLLDIPKAIIEKYAGKQKNGELLPVISNQNMNEYLHEIANICNIKKKITCHVARHSFATICLTEGVPIESVSKMLGHTNIRTTQIYARIVDHKLSNDMEALAQKLNGKTQMV